MPKHKHYSNNELNVLSDDIETQAFKCERVERYINRIVGSDNPDLNFDEKHWLYNSVLQNLLFDYRNPFWLEKAHILNHDYLNDCRFEYLFILCDYANDINGDNINQDFFSKKHFSLKGNKDNVDFLDKITFEWVETIKKKDHKDIFLQKVSEETRDMFEEEFNAKVYYEGTLKERIEKIFFLYYKFFYISSLKIFSNSKSFRFTIGSKEVIYDIKSFYHVARHFAKALKPDIKARSFFSKDFEIHNIFDLLDEIFNLANQKNIFANYSFSEKNQIFFKFNELMYSIWINKSSNLSGKSVLRVGSFYPSESLGDFDKYKNLIEIDVKSNLSFYI